MDLFFLYTNRYSIWSVTSFCQSHGFTLHSYSASISDFDAIVAVCLFSHAVRSKSLKFLKVRVICVALGTRNYISKAQKLTERDWGHWQFAGCLVLHKAFYMFKSVHWNARTPTLQGFDLNWDWHSAARNSNEPQRDLNPQKHGRLVFTKTSI